VFKTLYKVWVRKSRARLLAKLFLEQY